MTRRRRAERVLALQHFVASSSFLGTLKAQCDEDFAVLGQFCAKIITLGLKS